MLQCGLLHLVVMLDVGKYRVRDKCFFCRGLSCMQSQSWYDVTSQLSVVCLFLKQFKAQQT